MHPSTQPHGASLPHKGSDKITKLSELKPVSAGGVDGGGGDEGGFGMGGAFTVLLFSLAFTQSGV